MITFSCFWCGSDLERVQVPESDNYEYWCSDDGPRSCSTLSIHRVGAQIAWWRGLCAEMEENGSIL